MARSTAKLVSQMKIKSGIVTPTFDFPKSKKKGVFPFVGIRPPAKAPALR